MSREFIITAVTSILTVIVIKLLTGSKEATIDKSSDMHLLHYGISAKVFSLIPVLLMIASIVGIFLLDGEDRLAMIGMTSLWFVLGVPFAVECFKVKVYFNDKEIRCYSPWRKERIVAWDELMDTKFSHMMNWWVIKTTNHGAIRLSILLKGVTEFLETLQTKTGMSATKYKQ